jgi:hypothetical protein
MTARALSAVCLAAVGCARGGGGGPGALRVLFIGNSYTYENDLPGMVEAMGEAAGVRIEVASSAGGGMTLEDHWGGGSGKAARLIESGRFTHVVLQEQSLLPVVDRAGFRAPALQLARAARRAGSAPVFFVTWARANAPAMQAGLTDAYREAARDTGGVLAPVGPAWEAVRGLYPGLTLYAQDGSHPAPEGTYVAALVIFAALTGRSPQGLPVELSGHGVRLIALGWAQEQRQAVQQAAAQAVGRERAKPGEMHE